MDRVIYKNENLEIRSWDILKLKDGTHVGVFGVAYKKSGVEEGEAILVLKNPVSSIVTEVSPEHVQSVVEHCGCFENQMDWWFKNDLKKQETFGEYMDKVYEQLEENVTDEWREKYPFNVFGFTKEQVDSHVNHFIECYKSGMSPYKALTFFKL